MTRLFSDIASESDGDSDGSSDIAVAHKDYDVRGGGEILAERLARTFDCPLFVGHGDPSHQPAGSDLDIREIASDSWWHRLMDLGGAPRGIGHMLHWRDNAPEALADYDTIITSGNEPLWVMPRDQQTVVAYTHSTPRWMYDLYHESEGLIGRTYQQVQRRLYEGCAKRPDLWVANSDLVARRIHRYWNIPRAQIRVVYPPVDVDNYSPDLEPTQEYYLYVGRLAGHKRVDELVAAFQRLDAELVIAGEGPAERDLRAQASDNVRFEGYVSEPRKRELMAGAAAGLFPGANEDFGMVPIEYLAAGTPVITVREGFPEFQITNGRRADEGLRGYTYDRGAGNLRDAIRRFERDGTETTPAERHAFAQQFDREQFRDGMQAAVRAAQRDSEVIPSWVSGRRRAVGGQAAESEQPATVAPMQSVARPDGGEQ